MEAPSKNHEPAVFREEQSSGLAGEPDPDTSDGKIFPRLLENNVAQNSSPSVFYGTSSCSRTSLTRFWPVVLFQMYQREEMLMPGSCKMASWLQDEGEGSRTLSTIADDAMRLSLHILSKAAFGVPMTWPEKGKATRSNGLDHGHSMSYTEAQATLLRSIIWVLVCPHFVLSSRPLFIFR